MAKLIMTVAEMQDENKWLEMRNMGLGGSDASIVVGLNKWKSPFSLWLEKTGQSEPEDLSNNEYVYWGTVLEQVVADRFCELTGKKVIKKGMLQSIEYPFMLANVDRMIVGENAGLECKTANAFALKDWQDDELPDSYYVQCQHYMAVTGCENWYIAVLIGGQKFVWKEIPRNEEFIQDLIKAEADFWDKVTNQIMPDVDGTESCSQALGQRFQGGNKESIPLTNTKTINAVHSLVEVKKSIKELEELEDEYTNIIKAEMGNNELATVGDEYKVEWSVAKGRENVDGNKLKAENPEIYQRYLKVGNPYRKFTIKKQKRSV